MLHVYHGVKCECGFSGDSPIYVGFFPQEKIKKAHEKDPYMPKYGFHVGVSCPRCKKHVKWIEQTDDVMLLQNFYAMERV